MEFRVEDRVFEALPGVCFAVVAATGLDNAQPSAAIGRLLAERILQCQHSLENAAIKELDEVACYRDAFRQLNMNPNKYMCSIEALLSRIAKGKGIPSINAAVDLGNSVSLQYKLPIGAHDIDTMDGEISLRFSNDRDCFIPFGSAQIEPIDTDEIVYVSGNSVRTRKWIWRQSEAGKITPQTRNIFFPIDGFSDRNKGAMLSAQNELSRLLQREFGCGVALGWVDADHRSCIV